MLQHTKHNKSRELRSTPVLPTPHFSKTTRISASSLHREMGRCSTAVEPQQPFLGDFCASKTSPSSPHSWWEAAHVEERMCTLPKGLQKQTELPPREASGRFVTMILFLLVLAASLAPCSKKKPHLPFIAVETG